MSHVACEDENEGKITKIDENKGLNDKKAFEDQFMVF